MLKKNFLIVLSLLACAAISACGESPAARAQRVSEEMEIIERRAEAVARAHARVNAEVAQRKANAERLQAEAQERLRIEREEREAARQERLAAAQQQADAMQRRKAVQDLEAGFRTSLAIENTAVLQLRNPSGSQAAFQLRCYLTNGNYSTFAVAVAPGETKEIGFLEGWEGNFVSGEYCTAQYDGQALWRVRRA